MTAWAQQTSPTGNILRAVFGTGPRNVYAVGDSGTVIHWDGTAWSAETLPGGLGSESFRSVWCFGDVVVVCSNAGRVIRKAAGTWSDLGTPLHNTNPVLGMWGSSLRNIWLVQGNGIFQRSVDGGLTWSTIETHALAFEGTMRGFDATHIYESGTGWLFAFNGTAWVGIDEFTWSPLDVWPDAADTGYVVGDDHNVYRFTGYGVDSTPLSLPDTHFAGTSVFGRNAETVYAVGTNSVSGFFRALKLAAGAMVDDDYPASLSLSPNQVWVGYDGSAFAVGSGGKVIAKYLPQLALLGALAVTTNDVQVTLAAEPLAQSTIGNGDALNPATWTVTRVSDGQVLTVLAVSEVSPTVWNVRVLESFDAYRSPTQYRVSAPGLRDVGGQTLIAPTSQLFGGVVYDKRSDAEAVASTKKYTVTDIANPPTPLGLDSVGGVRVISAAGDFAAESGADLIKKLIYRRLITKPGEFYHLPNYGVGLGVKEPIPVRDLRALKKTIATQILEEPEVADVAVKVELFPGDNELVITMQVVLKNANQVVPVKFVKNASGVSLQAA